jgi:tetratricopeptide (TPR) repeat protein
LNDKKCRRVHRAHRQRAENQDDKNEAQNSPFEKFVQRFTIHFGLRKNERRWRASKADLPRGRKAPPQKLLAPVPKRDEFGPSAMSQILQTTAYVTLSAIGSAFLLWLAVRALKRSDEPAQILFKYLLTIGLVGGEVLLIRSLSRHLSGGEDYGTAFMMAGSLAACGIILGITWAPQLSDFLISPLTDLLDGGSKPPDPKPYYSIALAKRKLYRPLEAVVEIRKQLAQFPNDYEGISLLATIQAEDMKDLPGAEIMLNNFCDSPAAPPRQVAAALSQLADWHLKLAQDAGSARAALEKIIARFPGTELALAAAQRIAHLGGVEKILMAAHDRQPMAVPEGVKSIGLRDSLRDLIPAETDPVKLAADYVKHLEQHPLDTEAREKLAILYAAHYKRLDLATNELAQLINEPNQPPKHVAHWLNLLADLQIRSGADYETVRQTLEKITEHFPGMAVAELAQSRLAHLKLEIRGQKEETPATKLGVYEQNIGLKYGSMR